jgi:hypothetical protein
LLQPSGFVIDREEITCCFMIGPEEIASLFVNNSDDVLVARKFWQNIMKCHSVVISP